jgi:hypothetical protein
MNGRTIVDDLGVLERFLPKHCVFLVITKHSKKELDQIARIVDLLLQVVSGRDIASRELKV